MSDPGLVLAANTTGPRSDLGSLFCVYAIDANAATFSQRLKVSVGNMRSRLVPFSAGHAIQRVAHYLKS